MPVNVTFLDSLNEPPEIHQLAVSNLGPAAGQIMDIRLRGAPAVSFRIPARRIEVHQITRATDAASGLTRLDFRLADGVNHEDALAGLRLFRRVISLQRPRTNVQDTQQALASLEILERFVRINRIEAL